MPLSKVFAMLADRDLVYSENHCRVVDELGYHKREVYDYQLYYKGSTTCRDIFPSSPRNI
jgi:hypothetical protein